MMLFAEGGFLTDVAALLVAVGGLITAGVSLLKYLDERRKRKAAELKLGELLAATRRGDTVYFRGQAFQFVQWGGVNSRIETLDGSPSPLLKNRTNTDTCPNNQLFRDAEGTQRISR
jgi:hypothetical protein